MSRWTKKVTVSFDLKDSTSGEIAFYEADIELFIVEDFNYGADADGHRGIPMIFLDSINVLEVRDENNQIVDNITDEMYDAIEAHSWEHNLNDYDEGDDNEY